MAHATVPDDLLQVARATLAAMPDADGRKGMVAVPFPVARPRPFKLRAHDRHGAAHQKVALAGLHALEPAVRRKRVGRFLAEAAHYSHIPYVVQVGERRYILDGHHRLTADYLLGKRHAHVNLLALGDD